MNQEEGPQVQVGNDDRDDQRARAAINRRNRRARETPQEAEQRRARNAESMRNRRANENEQQSHQRRQSDRERANRRIANENEQQGLRRRHLAAAQRRNRRAIENAEQGRQRRQANLVRVRNIRENENVEQVAVRQREDRVRHRRPRRLNLAHIGNPLPEEHYLGAFNHLCEFCGAIKFEKEDAFKCCNKGKVSLPPLDVFPPQLRHLFTDNSNESKLFRQKIRIYNNAFAFASFCANLRPPPGHGPPTFRICGQIVHRHGNVFPGQDQPQFAQLYIIEAATALDLRMQNPSTVDCNRQTMSLIQDVLDNVSPYVASYKYMRQVEQEQQHRAVAENRPVSRVQMRMLEGPDQRRYNAPLHEEVAAVFSGEDGAPPDRSFVVYPHNAPLQTIPITSSVVDPLVYPLIFPRGDPGWDMNLPHVHERATNRNNHVTQLEFYAYRLAIRREFSALHLSCKLFQQYIVDAYTKVEGCRLNYIRYHQRELRAESYQGLVDHLENAAEQRNLNAGQVIVLPSTFIGSPRAMHQLYLDAMAVVCKYGRPDTFLTFTCNPKWREITENLLPNQKAVDRPDLVSRVYRMKLFAMKKEIMEDGILGMIVARVDVIEFQKRGLPHAHMLIHFAVEFKLRNADDIDRLICAQLPDPETEPELYEIIKSNMVHGPCGPLNNNSPCMVEGSCSKGYPKSFNEGTILNVDGFPQYHRPDNGRTVRVRNFDLDNRWIVPYCPYLSKKYNAHINLEACVSIKAVKYLYKYIYKGHDTAHIEISERIDHDEIKTFLDARYVSAPESCWRLFGFNMHTESHTVIKLAVHLPNHQRVYFRPGGEQNAAERAENNDTMLTAWFLLNQTDPTARQILYPDIPNHYVFVKSRNNHWKVRERGSVLTRMYNASVREGERYFLRVLLLHVPGATSFEYLRTYDGQVYPTFREACLARGLLADDNIWADTMTEVTQAASPAKIRRTFCTILIHGEPNNPAALWTAFKNDMMEDYLRNHNELQAEQRALGYIQNMLEQFGKSLNDFNLPHLDIVVAQEQPNAEANRHEADEIRPMLTNDQAAVSNAVLEALANNDNSSAKLFFLDGPGGTGKTFTYNYIIKEARARSFSVATSSWTGIAATLLDGGKTCHNLFKLPVPVHDGSTCNVKPHCTHAEFLRTQDIFIFDESSMIPKYALEAVDRMLRDISNSDVPFAGKVVLLGGDFRQTLPVVKRGNAAQVVESCLKSSRLWPLAQMFHLNQNMRAGEGEIEFANFLLQLGGGTLPTKGTQPFQGCIQIPEQCSLPDGSDLTDLIQHIFGNFENLADLTNKVILTPTNDEALEINEKVLESIAGETRSYLSFDSVAADTQEEIDLYPQEFLHSLTPSGMPKHKLNLKVGCVIMLLRNLSLKDGLCNGTRLKIHNLQDNLIDAEILTGVSAGQRTLIPRITFCPNDCDLPFQLKRIQFPVRLSYAVTINKSQGQTFDKVGIYLRRPCFSHGQLYVGFSRTRSFECVKVLICKSFRQGFARRKCYTQNVVYPQIL